MPDGRDPQEIVRETSRALATPGERPCLIGMVARDPYLEGDWSQHRYTLIEVHPAYARTMGGLPWKVYLRPGSPRADHALRASINQRVQFCGVTLPPVVQGGQRTAEVLVYDPPVAPDAPVPIPTPVPSPPAPPPSPAPAPGPIVWPQGVTEAMVQKMTNEFRQRGINYVITPENVRMVLQWFKWAGINVGP